MHVVLRLAFLSILVLQSALSQSVIVLQPDATCGKDAMVCDDPLYMKSLRNYGDNPDLLIYAWTDLGGPVYARSYLDFPLPPIADPSQVLSAKLSLFNSSDSPELEGKHWPMTGSNAGWIRRVTGAWDEHGITWANQPSSTDLRKVDIPRSLNAHQNYIDIDVTPLIRDIISDPAHGHGLVVMLQNEQEYRALVFASSDNEVPERHPRLVLELSDNKPWGPVTISIEGPSKVDFAGGHFQPNPITLRCTLTNTGSVAVELSNVHLFFQGLTALDPVLLSGFTLAPSESRTFEFRFLPLYTEPGYEAIVTLEANDRCGSLGAIGSHRIAIPAAPALSCDIIAADTLRFSCAASAFLPDPLPVTCDLKSEVTSVLSRIEVDLDLSHAPGLLPAQGESLHRVQFYLGGGNTARFEWMLVPADPLMEGMQEITIHYRYGDKSEWQDCSRTLFITRDNTPSMLRCGITGPEALRIEGEQLHPDPVEFIATVTNTGSAPQYLAQSIWSSTGISEIEAESCQPGLIPSGQSISLRWRGTAALLSDASTATISFSALDACDTIAVACSQELRIPGTQGLRCSVDAPDLVRFSCATATYEPAAILVTFHMRNPRDADELSVGATLDLSQAPGLTFADGETASRVIGTIPGHDERIATWYLRPAGPQISGVQRLLVHIHSDTQKDPQVVESTLLLKNESTGIDQLQCSIEAPVQAGVSDSTYQPDPFVIAALLGNISSKPIHLTRIVLNAPGLQLLDPNTMSGIDIAAGNTFRAEWRASAPTSRFWQGSPISLLLSDSCGGTEIPCAGNVILPGIDALRCSLSATDTVRFDPKASVFVPNPLPVRITIRNVLDTMETGIRANIDLSLAQRLHLPAGVSSEQTDLLLSGHEQLSFTWPLELTEAEQASDEKITIRFRSDQQSEWEECSISVHVEAVPPSVISSSCFSAGHDSVFVDPSLEQFIPSPLQALHTVTNTGTVPLTECRARIVLPPEFLLAGSLEEQDYGTILPGDSRTKSWMYVPSSALNRYGAFRIDWVWESREQGVVSGCPDSIEVVDGAPDGLVCSPVWLYFTAVAGGQLPAVQPLELWNGLSGNLSWELRSGATWLGVHPSQGSGSATIDVQPTTTALADGLYHATIGTFAAAPVLPQTVHVFYDLTSVTSVDEASKREISGITDVWPNPVQARAVHPMYVRFRVSEPAHVRLDLLDLLGRTISTISPGYFEGAATVQFPPLNRALVPGTYFIRFIAGNYLECHAIVVW